MCSFRVVEEAIDMTIWNSLTLLSKLLIDKSIFSFPIRAKLLVSLEGWQDLVVPTVVLLLYSHANNNIQECGHCACVEWKMP